MYFLKCKNCGHLNELTTESLLFCSGCNKKLMNNFRDWHLRNEDKTFEDFKHLMCVTGNEVISKPTKLKKNSKGFTYWTILIITFSSVFTLSYYFGGKLYTLFKYNNIPSSESEQPWIKEEYGNSGLYLETPQRLQPIIIPISDEIKEYVENSNAYQYKSDDALLIIVNVMKYKPEIGILDIQSAANGSAIEMKCQPDVSDFNYQQDYIVKNNISGFIQKGTFIKFNVQWSFINTGFIRETELWQIMISFKSDNQHAIKIAERVIGSIEFR